MSDFKFRRIEQTEEITQIEQIEKKYYKENALTVDILVPIANMLGFILIAESQEIIGYTAFAMTKRKSEMYCAALTVIPELRQKGIGSELLKRAEEYCYEAGIDNVVATGSPKNIPSLKVFLNRRNWRIVNLKRNFYRDGYDSFFYEKKLRSDIPLPSEKIEHVPLGSIDKILELLDNSFFGVAIKDDSKLLMQRKEI